MPINRYLIKKEKAFTSSMYRFFKNSQKQIQELLIKLDTQKDFTSDLEKLLGEIIEWTAYLIASKAKPVLIKGTKETAKFNEDFTINWELRNDPAAKYLESVVQIHTSSKILWSIWKTTYDRVLSLIKEWVNTWLSYTEIAKQMTILDPVVFSKYRAKMIAVAELGTAYEQGKYLPMKDLKDSWEIVLKKWQTVNDEKVRPEHAQNQSDWYIDLDIPFSWTWTKIAPVWVNCRCALIYKVI